MSFNINQIAQPIMINKNYDRQSIMESSALISFFAVKILTDNKAYNEINVDNWISNGGRKTVRNYNPLKSVNNYDYIGYPFDSENPIAASTLPMKYSDYPAKIKKAQVTGWVPINMFSLPPIPLSAPVLTFHMNSGLAMSTGKASAQLAHALFAYNAHSNDQELSLSTRLRVIEVSETELLDCTSSHIIDNGLTEIPKGSITVGW